MYCTFIVLKNKYFIVSLFVTELNYSQRFFAFQFSGSRQTCKTSAVHREKSKWIVRCSFCWCAAWNETANGWRRRWEYVRDRFVWYWPTLEQFQKHFCNKTLKILSIWKRTVAMKKKIVSEVLRQRRKWLLKKMYIHWFHTKPLSPIRIEHNIKILTKHTPK